jgi:hypothetical protein
MPARTDDVSGNLETTDHAAAAVLVTMAVAYAAVSVLALGWLAL